MIDQSSPAGPGPSWRDDSGATMRGFLAVVRRWRWMILIAALSAGLAGYVIASRSDRTYESRAVLLVGPLNTADPDTLKAAGQLAQTYAQIATNRPLLAITAQKLAAEGKSVRNLDRSVDASANAVTRLLTITARTTNADLSARIANIHGQVLIEQAAKSDASAQAGSGGTSAGGSAGATPPASESGQLQFIERAEKSGSPSGQSAIGVAILAAFGGLAGALGLALLLDRSGDAMTGPDELRAITGAGVLGTLSTAALTPSGSGRADRGRGRGRDEVAREYRVLAAKLNAIGERSLLIMAVDGEGTHVTRQLADALLAAGSRVAVVDAEHRALGRNRDSVPVDAPVGAGGGDAVFEEVADHRSPRIRVVTPSVEDEAGGADGARALLDELLTDCDVVLVSAPPLQRAPHALTWARVADGTVLVAQLDRTTRSDLAGAADNLRLVHARLLGTVVAAPPGMLRR